MNVENQQMQRLRTNPRFLAVEGIDGSGKSTVARAVAKHMEQRLQEYVHHFCMDNPRVVVVGAWEATQWTKDLRTMFVNGIGDRLTEMLLAFAARRALIQKTILPLLDGGNFVIADRFVATTLAYQTAELRDFVLGFNLHRDFCGGMTPGLTLYLEVDYQTARDRCASRGLLDTIEQRGQEFHERLDSAYAATHTSLRTVTDGSFIRIDANRPLDEVVASARQVVDHHLTMMFSVDENARAESHAFLYENAHCFGPRHAVPEPSAVSPSEGC